MQKCGGHGDKIARDLEIEFAHSFDVFKVLIGNVMDIDIKNIHLLLANQKQQKTERPLKALQLNVYAQGISSKQDVGPGLNSTKRRHNFQALNGM